MARLRLGQILLQAGVCDQEALRQAWEQKVLFGDRLGTNLLASALLDEKTLAQALGHQHDVAAGYGGLLHVDTRAVHRLARSVAVERFVVPHHFEQGVLYLLMRDPDDIDTRKQVATLTGLSVVPIVVCEARMWQLLSEHYGVSPGLRPVPLDEVAEVMRAQRQAERARSEPVASAGPELLSEDEFQALYMRRDTGPVPIPRLAPAADGLTPPEGAVLAEGAAAAAPTLPAAPVADVAAGDLPSVEGRPLAVDAVAEVAPLPAGAALDEAPVELTAQMAEPEVTHPGVVVHPVADAHVVSSTTVEGAPERTTSGGYRIELPRGWQLGTSSWPSGPALPHGEAAEALDPLPLAAHHPTTSTSFPDEAPVLDAEDASPVTFDEASALLQLVHTRDEIATIVLRYALSRFARAALLTVYPGLIVGWQGVPAPFAQQVRSWRVDRKLRSVFALVAESRAHYIGPLQTWQPHGEWVKRTGRVLPQSVAVFPILVRERCVNLLYGDNGHGEHVQSDVGELLILSQRIAASYEGLLGSAG